MIAKNKKGKSFGGCVQYVMNEGCEILAAEGVLAENTESIIRDFAIQRSGRPEIKQPVGHIAISFSPEDAPRLTNEFLCQLADEYKQGMNILNTQYVIVRHHNTDNPHIHIVYNRIDNDLKLISVNNDYKRNIKLCKKLKDKYNLTYGKGKEKVNRHKLTGADKVKYQIHDEIKANLPKCNSYEDLEKRLKQVGITIQYKYRSGAEESEENIQGVSFKKGNYSFKGSEIDRKFSHGNLIKAFSSNIVSHEEKTKVKQNPVVFGVELNDKQVEVLQNGGSVFLENMRRKEGGENCSGHIFLDDEQKFVFYSRNDPNEFVKYGKYEMRLRDKILVDNGHLTRAKVKWYGHNNYAYPYLWKEKPEDKEYKEQFGDPRIPKEVHEKEMKEFDKRIRRNIAPPKKKGPSLG